MGKVVKKILIGIAIIVSAGLLIPAAFLIGGATLAYSLVAVQLLGVSTIINAFAPDFDTGAGSRLLAENLSIFSSATAARTIVCGRAGIAGQILFRENIRNSGSDPDELLIILGLAGYPATSLEKFWLNGELIFDGDSTTGPGAITTGKFANELVVDFRTGEELSSAFPGIAALSTTWNAKTRILRGIPCLGIRLKITEKVDGRFQPLAQIKGSKLYDPRLDSTVPGGSGAHRFADPTTWAFSVNPKLAELLYLRGADVNGTRIFGMNKAAAAIDLENFAAEASVCEEQIDVVGGGTIDRYTCNGVLIPGASHKTNLQRLLSASAGTMDASGGVYRTFAGAWRSPSLTFTETDIDGAPTDMQLQIDPSKEINVISGVFAEPAEMWVVKEYPELTDAASITLFGENSKKLDLPFTTDHRIAQRISKIQMKRLNARRAFNANYWLRAASLQPGDILTQTYARYGITAETFRIDFWALEPSEDREGSRRLLVTMRLVEELQSWFDWDESTEEKSINAGGVLPPIDQPRLTEVFYIKPITGTAIQNGVGTLTVEAHRIFAGVDELLSTGTIQLFEGATLITVGNGYAAGSDGYTGVLDAGDISGDAIVELKDGAGGTVLDSITLVDVIDGADGADGADGTAGFNTATLTAYKRASSPPTDDPGTSITYTFATADWTPGNGWTKTIPAGANPVYALSATAFSQDATDEILSADWSAPTLILIDGDDGDPGDDGLNVATAFIYQRTATDSAPTLPSVTAVYTFATGNITGLNNGWTDEIPTAGTDDFLWISLATASNIGATDSIASGEWQAAEKLSETGADGDDGIPGLPGASFLADYDDADSNGSSSSQGKYHFLTSISDTSGTFTWATITVVSGVDFFSLFKTGTVTDYSAYFATVEVGDVMTWWITDRKWVAFKITSIETAPTDMFKWGVSLLSFDEFDDSGDISSANGVAVVLRFSRAEGPGPVRITGIGAIALDFVLDPTNAEAAIRVDNDGDVYKKEGVGASFISQGTWLGTGVVADYEVIFEGTGDTPTGSAVNAWLSCSTDRTWTLTQTVVGNKAFLGNLKWRDKTTLELLSTASGTISIDVDV